jgi:branched-subunit amino acid aminotransferase/4-amino-4-deoxychorismate lyase
MTATGAGLSIDGVPIDSHPTVTLRETCRVVSGRVPLWPYHRRRLFSGGCGEAMLMAADDLVALHAARNPAAPSSRIRLTLLALPDGSLVVDVKRRLSSLDVPGGPVAVPVAADSVEPPPLQRSAAKPADRSWWDECQLRARAARGDQAIIVSPNGKVIDGGTASVWIVEDGVISTPRAPFAVAGVARAFLLHRLEEAGATVRIDSFTRERFEAADEAFLTNAFGGCVPVRGRGGETSRSAAAFFTALWAG